MTLSETCPIRPNLRVWHRYTGKERDTESGLDYFGARYYGSSMGRFMSPDYSEGPDTVPYAHWSDPQTLNLYSYVRNNPLRSVDPDGHASYQPCNGGTQQCWQGDYDGEVYCKTSSGCVQWNGKTGEWDAYHPPPMDPIADGIKPDYFILETVAGGKAFEAAFGAIGGLLGRGAEGLAAKGAEETASSILSKQPEWANTPGGFVNWLKNLEHADVKLSASDADAVIAKAKQLNVDVRLDPPHPGTDWNVPHLNIGQEGQVHLEVPSGYNNPTVPAGAARRP